MIHLMAGDIKANAESTMKVHLKQKALTGAEVQLEIWKDGVEKQFIPAKEGNKGEYETNILSKKRVLTK